jgi:hypothetical protein
MLSGRSTAWLRDARHYVGALTGDIKKTYPQLGDVAVDYAWAGTLGITMHRMPQIGELGPGVWLASGFGGHGLNTTAMAGNLVARAIVEGDQTWRQFTPFELVWAGGGFGRAAAQMRVWIKRLRDATAQRRSKARELAHRQAREAELTVRTAQQSAPQHDMAHGVAHDMAHNMATDLVTPEQPAAATDSIIPPPVMDDRVRPEPEPQSNPGAGRSKRRKRRQDAKT